MDEADLKPKTKEELDMGDKPEMFKYLKEKNGKEEFTDLQEAWAIFSRAATSQPVRGGGRGEREVTG